MSLNKKSVDDINVKGLRVLCRCDFNVPLKDGKITDENRLVAALPTIKKLIADGGKVILCSHLGKVKTEEDKKTKTLAPVAVRLSELLGQEVKFVADPEVVGPNARAAVEAMKDGEVILLENTRFRPEETKNGEAFSKDLASICDVFVNDAFGTAHRAHCSNVGVAQLVDTAVVGYLMQKEIDFLGNAVEKPVRPFVAILGGAKVADKLNVISNLLEKCDTLIIGGGMAFTFAISNVAFTISLTVRSVNPVFSLPSSKENHSEIRFLLPSCSSAFLISGWKIITNAITAILPVLSMSHRIVSKWNKAARSTKIRIMAMPLSRYHARVLLNHSSA